MQLVINLLNDLILLDDKATEKILIADLGLIFFSLISFL
jgi:hypothetical protein